MVKRLVMASGAAVLAVAVFLLAASGDRRPAPPQAGATPPRVREFISRPTTQPEKVLEGGDLKLTPGDRTFAVIYDRVTGDPKYQFRADRWEPISETEFQLTRPELRVHMPGGQITYVRSDEGQIALAQSGRRSVEPKRGWLRGNVCITVDRTTREWRAAHPDQAELEQHDDQTVKIYLTDITFDLDRARLESNGALRVESEEARIDGRGLVLAWNQVDNRIDALTIHEGRRMELRRGGKMIDFAMPGSQREPGARPPRSPRPRSDRPPPGPAGIARARPMSPTAVGPSASEAAAAIRAMAVAAANRPADVTAAAQPPAGATAGGLPPRTGQTNLAEAAEQMVAEAREATNRGRDALDEAPPSPTTQAGDRDRRKIDTYSAVFVGDVVVEQRQGLQRPGRMTCEKLELIFDWGRKQKRSRLFQPRLPGAAPATRPAREEEPPPFDPNDETRLVLTWTGPLEMRPLMMPPDEQSGDRFDAIATGKRVEVNDARGRATCTQLVYRNETQQVWLAGSDAEPVVIETGEKSVAGGSSGARRGNSGRLSGREIFFDRQRGIARIVGPGTMDQPPTPAREAARDTEGERPALAATQGGTIHWTRGVEIELKQESRQQRDPATGQARTALREYLARAWFHGDVRIDREDQHVRGEDVAATFAPPRRDNDAAGPITHLDLAGRVLLKRGADEITADQLEVDFDNAAGSENSPRSALARGNVVAVQGDRRISGDEIAVTMTTIDRPADPAAGPRPRRQLAITSLHARRGVRAFDRDQKFRATGEELHALIPDGRRIQRATAVGDGRGGFASVRFGDYELAGPRIEMNMPEETADVPGAGRAKFISDRDFGGGELGRTDTVRVAWNRSLRVRGRENTAVFEGAVTSWSKSHRLDCDRLTVILSEAPRPSRPRAAAPRSPLDRFKQPPDGLFGWRAPLALAALDALRDHASKFVASLPPELRPAPRPRASSPLESPLAGGRRKQPARVIASGNATALRTIRHARTGRLLTRAQMRGDEIDVDLRRQSLNIPGRGTLLIEDYEIPTGRRGRRPSAPSSAGPAGSASLFGGGTAPSQTLFRWANGMSYFVDQALVTFDRQVEMRHVSGQYVVLKESLAAAMRVDPETLRSRGGRKAELSCDNLLVQFVRRDTQRTDAVDVRGAALRQLVARGSVHLQEGTKSIMGEQLSFSSETNLVTVEGAANFEARIFDQEESSQRFNMWRGPLLTWDRSADRIEAPHARIMSRGR